MTPAELRPKHCHVCRSLFGPRSSFATCCSPPCAIKKATADRLAQAKQERADTRKRKAALQTIPELIKLTQRDFNGYIRFRDKAGGFPCISSGRVLDWSSNSVDAGHYRSVGAASHLRFDERNVHAQSKHDNQYKAGNVVDYRINLIQRIGIEAVEALEADNKPHKWTREELLGIRAEYKAKLKEMKDAE